MSLQYRIVGPARLWVREGGWEGGAEGTFGAGVDACPISTVYLKEPQVADEATVGEAKDAGGL